jgi:5-methylcytosine-specific restriction endonuclease McrA
MNTAERGILAHLCHHFNEGHLTRRQFSDAVFGLVCAWDIFSTSSMFAQVEATVETHFCEWWDGCDNGCSYATSFDTLPPWRDGWATLEWKERHAEPKRESVKVPHNRAKDARSAVSPSLRLRIFARDGHKCQQCGAKPPLELDHIMPVSKGGSAEESNLQALCVKCNRAKRDSVPQLVET